MSSGGQYIGSFQTGTKFESENPCEEVWSRVAQHGSADNLRKLFTPPSGQDVEPYVEYAGVRVRQAVEFRKAARQSTLLTSPLSLYYSFLNLTRASMCLAVDDMTSKGHGLTFQGGEDLLSSGAKLARGTFTDYLDASGAPWKPHKEVTLHDALSRIIEIRFDYTWPHARESYVIPLGVDAYFNGDLILNIPKRAYDLSLNSSRWTSELPSVAGCCVVDASKNALKVKYKLPKGEKGDHQAVNAFCSMRLESDLIWQDLNSRWYLVRQVDPDLVFPRPAYYLLAVFILGSVVRYEPELMLETTDPDSHLGWLLRRVIQAAERFFPQLMLGWVFGSPVYF